MTQRAVSVEIEASVGHWVDGWDGVVLVVCLQLLHGVVSNAISDALLRCGVVDGFDVEAGHLETAGKGFNPLLQLWHSAVSVQRPTRNIGIHNLVASRHECNSGPEVKALPLIAALFTQVCCSLQKATQATDQHAGSIDAS